MGAIIRASAGRGVETLRLPELTHPYSHTSFQLSPMLRLHCSTKTMTVARYSLRLNKMAGHRTIMGGGGHI